MYINMDNIKTQLAWIDEKIQNYDNTKIHTFKKYELIQMKEELLKNK